MKDKIAIIGAGDLGLQIAHYIKTDTNHSIVGFFDDTKSKGEILEGYPILGKIDDVESQFEQNCFKSLLIGIGYKHLAFNKVIFNRFSQIPFATFIHSSVIIDPTAEIKSGAVIFPGCLIDKNVIVGSNALLNVHCTISHDTIIGAHSFLSPRVAIAGFCTLGEQCLVGINSTIVDNINIVSETRIGAGAVVTRSISEGGLYVGVPAIRKK